MVYSGMAAEFCEAEFRTMLHMSTAATPEDKALAMITTVDALRGEAMDVAMTMGLSEFASQKGHEKLIEGLRQRIFPHAQAEARELLARGMYNNGTLARGNGDQ